MKEIKVPKDAFPVLACLPVNPETWHKHGFIDIKVPSSYTKSTCQMCSCEIYIGPTQKEFLQKHPETMIQCFECSVAIIKTGNIAGIEALDGDDRCQMFTKKGEIFAKVNPNN